MKKLGFISIICGILPWLIEILLQRAGSFLNAWGNVLITWLGILAPVLGIIISIVAYRSAKGRSRVLLVIGGIVSVLSLAWIIFVFYAWINSDWG